MEELFEMAKFDSYKEDNRREVKRAEGGLPNSLWDTYSAFAVRHTGKELLYLLFGIIGKQLAAGILADQGEHLSSRKRDIPFLKHPVICLPEVGPGDTQGCRRIAVQRGDVFMDRIVPDLGKFCDTRFFKIFKILCK